MYWADKLVSSLDKSKKHRVDDMKTLSGMPHIGSLRAILTHDIVYKVMKSSGFDVVFSYVFNSLDPMDGLPVYLDKLTYQEHMGKPLYKIPSPIEGYASYGEYYALKYKETFNILGCEPEIYWSHELYEAGKFNDLIKMALDDREEIRKIYFEVAKKETPDNWYPFQVVCPNCGKIGTTFVSDWDGKEVTYECKPDLVKWAVGCGHKGKVSPYNGNGKLFWKVDWPAHWAVLDVTVEGAGKDHFTKGGSRDFGVEIMKRVFKKEPPFGFMHEFLLVGGHKMSSSKGVGLSADKAVEILPPELVRFLVTRVPYQRAINFDPEMPNTIPDLFDEYDRCADNYYQKGDKDLAEAYVLSQIAEFPAENFFRPRFKQVVTIAQMPNIDIYDFFEKQKDEKLSQIDRDVIDQRLKYAKYYLENFADPKDKFTYNEKIPELAENLTVIEKKALIALQEVLEDVKSEEIDGEKLQNLIFEKAKSNKIDTKTMFSVIYKVLLGKTSGPKAGWLIVDVGIQKVLKRITELSP
jgi:lysyl-tRNA synthetase, class I